MRIRADPDPKHWSKQMKTIGTRSRTILIEIFFKEGGIFNNLTGKTNP